MAKIEIMFGGPTSDKVLLQNEEWAFNHEVSIESANIGTFNAVMNVLVRKNEDNLNYFDLCFISLSGGEMIAPKITSGTHLIKRTRYPKLTIHGDYLKDRKTNTQVLISDQFAEQIGRYIEEDFDYEYLEISRVGSIKANKSDVIYLIGDKPHLHLNGKFIKAKK